MSRWSQKQAGCFRSCRQSVVRSLHFFENDEHPNFDADADADADIDADADADLQDGAWVENKGIVLAFHHEAWKDKVQKFTYEILPIVKLNEHVLKYQSENQSKKISLRI